jgi:hypothetical protein
MTATYVAIVGANMVNSIVNASAVALAKTNTLAGNGRPSRTRLVLRLDDIDATSTADDRTVTMVCKAPPGIDLTGGFGTAFEDQYLPMLTVSAANAATQALVVTTRPFLAVSAVDVTNRTITVVFTTITGGDNMSFFVEADWSFSMN